MSIEFHCPYCTVQIKAPDNAGGKRGKCPKCKQSVYIPKPTEELDEFDLAPLDDEEEIQRKKMRQEVVDIQRQAAGESIEPSKDAATAAHQPGNVDDVPSLVVQYLLDMSQSKLEDAERIAEKLSEFKRPAVKYIKQLAADDSTPPELAGIPAPLLQGFLKTLRGQL